MSKTYYILIGDDWDHAVVAESADAEQEAITLADQCAAEHLGELADDGSEGSGWAAWAVYPAGPDGGLPDWDEAEPLVEGVEWAHPEAPECVDEDDHDWDEYGVRSGGGEHFYADSTCGRCGVKRTVGEDHQAYRDGGEQGVEYVRYDQPAAVTWSAWADDHGHEPVNGEAHDARSAIEEAIEEAETMAEETGEDAWWRVTSGGVILAEGPANAQDAVADRERRQPGGPRPR